MNHGAGMRLLVGSVSKGVGDGVIGGVCCVHLIGDGVLLARYQCS
jgi:hypothetical protein